jgi:SAM-dependent methyltransferase
MGLIRGLIRLSVLPFPSHNVHLTRHLEYESLREVSIPRAYDRVASISGSERLCRIMNVDPAKIVSLDFPEFDARDLPFPDGHFDVCIADQVMEHVEGGGDAFVRECARVVRNGGLFVNATVATYPIHYGPKDLRRFTPEGLREMLESAGFEVVKEGSWGGRRALLLVALDLAGLSVPCASWHPIKRIAEKTCSEWPIVVWAVGRKQGNLSVRAA